MSGLPFPHITSSSSSQEEAPKEPTTFWEALNVDLDKEAQAKCNRIWFERGEKAKACDSLMALHPEHPPVMFTNEDPVLLFPRGFVIHGEWGQMSKCDQELFFFTHVDPEVDADGNQIAVKDIRVYSSTGRFLRRFQDRRDWDSDYGFYFGIPISHDPGMLYRRGGDGINVRELSKGLTKEDVYENEEGLIVGIDQHPHYTEKSRVVHCGRIPFLVQYDGNADYISYFIRNMITDEVSHFIFTLGKNEIFDDSVIYLRGEFYSHVTKRDHVRNRRTSRIIHGRSNKTVWQGDNEVDGIVTGTDFISLSVVEDGVTTVYVLQ